MNNKQNKEAMTLSARNTLIPKLRFPKFELAEAWVTKPLGSIGQTLNGLSGKSGDDFGQGKPFITYKQVFDCASVDLAKCELVKIGENENQNEIKRGDILFTTSSETPDEVGYASVVLSSPSEPVYLNSFCFSFRPNSLNELVPEFSRYLFHSPIYRKLVIVLAQGSTRFNISKVAFLKLALPLPQTEEQKKIADCIASLDEIITLEAKKLDAIKAHKKGLMQQLLPVEGETVPKLRFPEFREAAGWEIQPFKKLFSVGNGRDYKHLSTGNFPVYGSGGYMLSVDEYLYDGESVCIGRKGTIDNPILLSGKFWTVDTLFYTHSFNECLPKFIYAIFQAIDWLKHNEAGGVPSLSKANIEKIEVAIPKLIEQQKIADCLSLLDELIALEAQKLDALKIHKKGLMQQLFPQVGEAHA